MDFSSGEDKERLLSCVPAPEEKDYGPLYEAVGRLPEKLNRPRARRRGGVLLPSKKKLGKRLEVW